jgi:hypothetical protein
MGQSRRFSASSPVTRYWLANCVGFSLTGGGHGTVERVLSGDDPFVPSLLEVRTGRHRLRCVPTESVVEVVPAEQLLVIAGRNSARPERSHETRQRFARALTVARHIAVAVGVLLLGAATRLAQLARAAWRHGYPVAVTAGRRGGKESARLVRSVPWQQYGRSARSATTRLSQARSNRSSPRRTTSSEPSNATSSADRARTTSST